MAASDSASSLIKKPVKTRIMEVRPYTSIKANILLNISEIHCYLINKLEKKTAFNTNGIPGHLNIVSDFHTLYFPFFTSLNN